MSWLEGLAEPDWRMFHSDSEVQIIAKETLELLKEQESAIKSNCDECESKNDYCEGCKLRGMPDCPRSHSEDGNFVCPNGRLK